MVYSVLLAHTFIILSITGFSEADLQNRCPDVNLEADSTFKYISSRQYLKNESSSEYCQWTIESSMDDESIEIKVMNCDLNVRYDGFCPYSSHSVEIQEIVGPDMMSRSVGVFCGKLTPTFYTISSTVVIRFKYTTKLLSQQGFRLRYRSGIFGSIGDEDIPTTYFGVRDEAVTFSEPSVTLKTDSRFVKEAWHLQSPKPYQEIYLKVLKSSLPEDCMYNFMEAFEGKDKTGASLGKWCGDHTPDMIIAKGNIFVILHARNFNEDSKFEIEYGIYVRNATPMIVGIFVGVILFCGLVVIAWKVIQTKCKDDDDDEDDNNRNDNIVIEQASGNQTLNESSSTPAPPTFGLRLPPTAPPVDVSTEPLMPPPSYEDVMKSPVTYT